ncbi:hypothetical protein [Chondromyces apiculatus]|uniref:Lipoprotein n=1 Tax=Chondromyces apiculatus DSM 436 TaxID=1192034 RepID=A0A017T8Y8_9BACT|nr:hypothetical protein [Chondromyces apiculatus]EYF05704.1 Hypothetical protein CAP_2994 [Chondromyces apiculatus DSM 436]
MPLSRTWLSLLLLVAACDRAPAPPSPSPSPSAAASAAALAPSAQSSAAAPSAPLLMVPYGMSATSKEGVRITFLEVISDERCPAGSKCEQAGVAKLRVQFTEPGAAPGPVEEIAIFGGSGEHPADTNNVKTLSGGLSAILGMLQPYPGERGGSIEKASYSATFVVLPTAAIPRFNENLRALNAQPPKP